MTYLCFKFFDAGGRGLPTELELLALLLHLCL
jgi:hypothetical protein